MIAAIRSRQRREDSRESIPRFSTRRRISWIGEVGSSGTAHLIVPVLDGQGMSEGKPVAMNFEVGRLAASGGISVWESDQ